MKTSHTPLGEKHWGRVTLPGLLVLVALCLGWALLPQPSARESLPRVFSNALTEARAPAPFAPAPVLEAPSRADSVASTRYLPCDRLTEQPLDLSRFSVEAEGRLLTLDVADGLFLSPELLRHGVLHYEVPTVSGLRPFELPAPRARVAPADNRLLLPYRAGVHGMVRNKFTGSALADARIVAYLFDPERLEELRRGFGRQGTMPQEALDDLAFLVCHYENAFGEVPQKEAFSREDGSYELTLPASGPVVIHAWHESCISETLRTEVVPGEWTDWDPSLDLRPIVTGTVLDEHKQPLAGVRVKVGVSMEAGSAGLSPLDNELGFATVQAARSAGDRPVSAGWRTVVTDRKGRYRLPVPKASRYAASVILKSSYVFEEREVPGGYQPEIQIDLVLQPK